MNTRSVTSLTNPTVKAVRALHLRKEREQSGLFLAEGLKIVTEAVELGRAPRILLYGSDAGGRSFASQLAKVHGAQISEADKQKIFCDNLRGLMLPILKAKGIKA